MAALPANPDEVHARTPPRYRWLIRIAVGYALLLAGLVGLWFWWDAYSRARLDAKIAALRAAGEPTRVEDFPLPSVADELNAARALSEASALIINAIDPKLPGVDDFVFFELELNRGLFEFLDALISLNQEPLCLIREARELRKSNATRFGGASLPVLSACRRLAKLEMAAAFCEHVRLDDAHAIEHLRDGLAVGWIVSNGAPPSVIAELVGASIDAVVCEVISSISAELLVTDSPVATVGPVSRVEVSALINELLADSDLRERMRRAFQMDRIEMHSNILQMADGVGAPAPLGMRVIGPSIRLEGRVVLDRVDEIGSAVAAANPRGERDRLSAWAYDEKVGGIERVRTTLRRTVSGLESVLDLQAARLVQRRMAATALAIRLFQLDHGRRPVRLEELVPTYLTAVPIDLFRPDGGWIGYRLESGHSRLYSVGNDGIDDGGIRKTSGGYRSEIILLLDPPEELPDPSVYYFPALLDESRDEP
ncbi:MAG: hypothetical protein IT450_00815 [Phycisphaerales bacterium]|nr:hypothetical protein [Phycisphaerales bacterium]